MEEPGYFTVADLLELGWTKGLIGRYLGPPNRYFPVDHFLNWTGKKAWRVEWVELTEMTQGFEAGFLRSARTRGLSREATEEVIDRIYLAREESPYRVVELESDCQQRLNACASGAADLINEARRRGYRTPHKC